MIEFDYNPNTNKLITRCESELFQRIRDNFSVIDKNAKFARRVNKFASSKKYLITPTGLSDIGMYWEIRKFLIVNQITTQYSISSKLEQALTKKIDVEFNSNFEVDLRYYQLDVIKSAINCGRGVCVLGTGAGKSFITAALVENYYKSYHNPLTFKCLVIVPDLGLVQQTYDEFIKCGVTFKLSMWTGSVKYNDDANVIICNMGILQSQIDTNEWVNYVDLLIVDEVHKVKPGNKVSDIISKIKTHHKFGFTGTLPECKYEQWFILGKFGPVLYEKTSYDLRSENYLTNVEVKVIKLKYNVTVPRKTNNLYRNELEFIYENNGRNTILAKIANKLDSNTLILVNHINHGELLYEKVKDICKTKQVYFIRGEVDVLERENIKKIMENTHNVVCIAISAIFSTGVNIKNIHNIVFAAGGKSFIRTVQSIGRGLRLHETKEKLVILDICDDLKYGNSHCLKRQEIYLKEQIKFTENTLLVN
jgi:superfamily II DNA or RNA helicase